VSPVKTYEEIVRVYKKRQHDTVVDTIATGLIYMDEVAVDSGLLEETGILTELRNRLATIEKKLPKEASKEKKKAGSIIRDATWLVAIAAGAWVIVTIINKFF